MFVLLCDFWLEIKFYISKRKSKDNARSVKFSNVCAQPYFAKGYSYVLTISVWGTAFAVRVKPISIRES